MKLGTSRDIGAQTSFSSCTPYAFTPNTDARLLVEKGVDVDRHQVVEKGLVRPRSQHMARLSNDGDAGLRQRRLLRPLELDERLLMVEDRA